MRKSRFLLLVATTGLFLAADPPEDAVKKGLKKLQGTWKFTSFEADGNKPYDDVTLRSVTTTIDGDRNFKAEAGDVTVVEATIKIDPTKKPKTIDFIYTSGSMKGQIALGIYEVTDDTLKYCRAEPDKPRPTEFSSKPGSQHTLASYKRAKSK